MLTDGSETLLDVPIFHELVKCLADENTVLVGDDVLWWAEFSEGVFEGVDCPCGVWPFDGNDGDDFSGIMVDGEEHVGWPNAPVEDDGVVDRPDVVGIEGRDLSRFSGFRRLVFRGGFSRLGAVEDVSDRGGGEKDTESFELIGDFETAPIAIDLSDLPDEGSDAVGGLVVRRSKNFRGVVDFAEPSVEGRARNAEVFLHLVLRYFVAFHKEGNSQSLFKRIVRLVSSLSELAF